ncbi:sodium/calcium exchanger 2-like protein [Novosphingobium nitrogenifigens DSM 19370]|uniref:Sodium/calcium exchanger 2-like protein n=1 Tax=Novosphingobium nitrogenifigens DSM 19370 TaxID=983920 RepID=F1ZBG2_9SPHN|nr:sodium/calcium exchanger 2-like protein [Novosphingobium nitrogenifigens DSM 19370]
MSLYDTQTCRDVNRDLRIGVNGARACSCPMVRLCGGSGHRCPVRAGPRGNFTGIPDRNGRCAMLRESCPRNCFRRVPVRLCHWCRVRIIGPRREGRAGRRPG